MTTITGQSLGSAGFKSAYGLRYAYLTGAMYKGIASKELVVAMGRAGMLGYFGAGGLHFHEIESAIEFMKASLSNGQAFGINFLCHLDRPEIEEQTVDVLLRRGVRNVEAAAFMRITPSLVRWRLTGLRRLSDGQVEPRGRTLAKVSRPEVALAFMQPAPEAIVRALLESKKITAAEAETSGDLPMADDICVEADSGGHTDQGVALALLPTMLALRDEMMLRYRFPRTIRVGAAGGIGAPQAVAAAFIMGADFVMTGSINQCTVEAGTSAPVKDILQEVNVQDTTYAPAGDMFELGARVQVAKRGLFFPARANKLYELYQRYNSIEEIDPKTRQHIEQRFFKRSFEAVWEETRSYYVGSDPAKLREIEKSPKQKMAAIFKWYFIHTTRLALSGSDEQRIDYQIHCGPALGAFNQWVKGTELQPWQNRRVADIASRLLSSAAALLNERFAVLHSTGSGSPPEREAGPVAIAFNQR